MKFLEPTRAVSFIVSSFEGKGTPAAAKRWASAWRLLPIEADLYEELGVSSEPVCSRINAFVLTVIYFIGLLPG